MASAEERRMPGEKETNEETEGRDARANIDGVDVKMVAETVGTVDIWWAAATIAATMTEKRWTGIAEKLEEVAETGSMEGKNEMNGGAINKSLRAGEA